MKWVGAAAGGLALLVIGFYTVLPRTECVVTSLQEAREKVLEAGYHCTSDAATGKLISGFLVTRKSITWNDVGRLRKSGDMGPEWKGKVWVTINPRVWKLSEIPRRAGARMWGEILAFGDEDFLNEIDEALRHS